jgi:undecaprenyl-diphosphatase
MPAIMQHIGDLAKVKKNNPKQTSNCDLGLLLICLISLTGFAFILFFKNSFTAVDYSINLWVPSIQQSFLTEAAKLVSFVFGTYVMFAATIVTAAYLALKNNLGKSMLLLGAMGTEAIAVAGVKSLVSSSRPLNGLSAESGFSFPSGHTVGSIVFCGIIAYFAWQHWKTPQPRAVAITLFATISSIVGFDRLYLNVHWFSDILGGANLGLCLLVLFILLSNILKTNHKLHTKKFRSTSGGLFVLGIFVVAVLLATKWL